MLLWVVLAGGLGSGARYLLGVGVAGATFPYATLIVNVLGSFILGVVAQLAANGAINAEARTVIAVGFLGGFTTYSSFNQETLTLFASGRTSAAMANVAITLAGCLAAGLLGMVAARAI